MSMSDADKLARAYAHLTAIRKTVVDMGAANIVVGSGIVEQYADALLHLQDIGQDVDARMKRRYAQPESFGSTRKTT